MKTNSPIQQEKPVVHSTFVLERRFAQTPERVFAAFADPAKKRRWFSDGSQSEVELYEQDFRVGGTERLRYRMKEGTPIAGRTISSEGAYLDIVENRRVVTASAMALDGRRFSASLVTIELAPLDGGTELICTHQSAFFEGSDGPQMREAGWRGLFDKLAKALDGE